MSIKPKLDVHQHITDQIIAAIESAKDLGSFEMPWHQIGNGIGMPKNALTKKRYQGVNVLALSVAAMAKGYTDGTWATFKQWSQIKGADGKPVRVRKGEKGTVIVFFKVFEAKQDEGQDQGQEGDASTPESRVYARASYVFNAAQVDGYQPATDASDDVSIAGASDLRHVDAYVANTGALIKHHGEGAFYRPTTDQIFMPHQKLFKDTQTSTATEGYYSTLLHELVHWTGADKRCGRGLSSATKDKATYAGEELVAEIGAAFLCADLAVTSELRDDHVQYIASWLKALKNDKRAIFTAASRAQKAVNFLNALQASDQAKAAA